MLTKTKIKKKAVDSTTTMYVVSRDGVEIGTVARYGKNSRHTQYSWSVYAGIGHDARHIGNDMDLNAAVQMLAQTKPWPGGVRPACSFGWPSAPVEFGYLGFNALAVFNGFKRCCFARP